MSKRDNVARLHDSFLSDCRAVLDGDDWVINGEKYFSSNADLAEFLIAMVITKPDVPVHQGASMFLIPTATPGVNIVRLAGLGRQLFERSDRRAVLPLVQQP